MLRALLVTPVKLPELAASVYPVPALSMESPLKRATPFTAFTLAVPDSVPPPALFAIARVTASRAVVMRLPLASRTSTSTAGEIAAPAVPLVGCVENASWVGATAPTDKDALPGTPRPSAEIVAVPPPTPVASPV